MLTYVVRGECNIQVKSFNECLRIAFTSTETYDFILAGVLANFCNSDFIYYYLNIERVMYAIQCVNR